jgi:hypothetical protein
MKIIQMPPRNRRHEKAFIDFPFKLYQNNTQWVPPLRMEMRKIFKPNYPFYQYGQASFFLAVTDAGEVLGRLAVASNDRYNEFHHTKTAFFYYFECINDLNIAQALFSRGFEWSHTLGLNHVLGPKGFTVLDGFGMLVKGFEHRPAFGQPYNPAYYPELIEAIGFTKVKDVFSGWIDRNSNISDKIFKAAEIVEKRMGFTAPMLNTKSELRKVINDFKLLYNDSLAVPAGNPPISDEDMDNMVRQLLWIADPRLVKLIYKDDRPVGWILAYPDVGAALQRIKGRLLPFGWLHILLESKKTNWFNLNGIGIIEEYQRLGGTAILFNEFYQSVMKFDQYQYAELLQMREENTNILLESENLDVNFHKTHRLYERNL